MKQLLTFAFLFLSLVLWAQPANDDCSGLIDLGVAPACPDSEFFSNVDATPSDIGFGNNPSCFNGGAVDNDVWFAFTTSDTIFDYTISVTGISDGMGSEALSNPQIALYRGECVVDGLAELACESAAPGESFLELDVEGLTPNVTYFIRINDYSATATPNWGTFQLCVDEISPINTIDEDGSSACSGELYDSGGPDGDYANNEDNVFTVCPSQPNGCINFMLEYYNIEASDFLTTDQLIFYDSDEVDPNAVIAELGGADFGVEGDQGGGAVCFSVQASSGCLTVRFVSDGNVTMDGFAGAWECTTTPCDVITPMTAQSNITATQIEDVVATPQTSVTVTDINCADQAYGLFDAGDESDLGLGRGLLLTTGQLSWSVGPNTNDGGGNTFEADNGMPGDPDLDYLSDEFGDGSESNDACIVEMDVIPASNELTFEYVFGSEEYPEFVNQFNDIFAFLISGPGIVGDPNLGGQENIAVLPDNNNTLVQINSVNNLINWEYYRNNENGQSVQYDGLTSDLLGVKKSLTARADVIPCSTYHLKLAIADRGDFVYDSGVFITEISGGTPNLTVQFNSGVDYLIEDCTNEPDNLIISLNAPLDDTISYNVTIGGTAELGVDYLLEDIPDVVTFLPGETEFSFPITTLSDLEMEPTETIIISLDNDFGCGTINFAELEIELRDQLNIEIFTGQDTALVCQDSTLVLEVSGAANYFWTPVSVFDDPLSTTPVADPDQSQWVFVEGTLGPCMAEDSIFLQVVDPMITIDALDPTAICEGESVRLEVTDNVNNSNLTWFPTTGLDDPNSPTPVASPADTTEYIASVEVAGCLVSDTILIDVAAFDFPDITADTTICENYSVQLASVIDPDTTNTVFVWTPSTGLDNDSIAHAIATPDQTTTYQLIATSSNDACADTAEVTVTVLPADVEIQGPDTLEICLGESVDLTAVTSIGTAEGLVWSPDDGTLSDTSGLTVTAMPELSTTYFTSLVVGACEVFDSVHVRVDSIPAMSELMGDPEKDPYCQGEIVTLSSPTYEPVDFPDIEHLWLEGPGYESQDTLWNMVLTTQDTFTYQRVTTNRACVDTTEITLNVVVPSPFTIEPMNPVICPGESVQLVADYMGQMGEISWEPETGLSCTDCLNPVATPMATTTYTMTVDVEGCPVSASASVNVLPPPAESVIGDTEICLGDPIQLNGQDDGTSTYSWTSPDDPDFSSVDPLLVVSPDQTTTYILIAQNGDCEPIERMVTITVVQPADVTVSEDVTVCGGDEIVLSAEGTAPDGVSESFVWSWPDNSENGAEISVNSDELPFGETVFTLAYTYGPDCETLTETVTVTVNPAPQLEFPSETDFCLEDPPVAVTLNLDPDFVNTTYSWTSDTGFSSSDPAPVVSPTATTTYSVVAETPGCPPLEESVTITITPDVFIELPEDYERSLGQETDTIAPMIMPPGDYPESYFWSWPNGTSSEPFLAPMELSETTTFALDYTYGPGCGVATDSITITIVDFDIPNVFTPNDDGVNDVFRVVNSGTIDIKMFRIFNRWGQVVFESTADDAAWDGRHNGNLAPSDVYVYHIIFELGGVEENKKGDVTLLR